MVNVEKCGERLLGGGSLKHPAISLSYALLMIPPPTALHNAQYHQLAPKSMENIVSDPIHENWEETSLLPEKPTLAPFTHPGGALVLTLGSLGMPGPSSVAPGKASPASIATGPAEDDGSGATSALPPFLPPPAPRNVTTTHPSSPLLTTTPWSLSSTPGGSPSANLTTGAPAGVNPRNRAGISLSSRSLSSARRVTLRGS